MSYRMGIAFVCFIAFIVATFNPFWGLLIVGFAVVYVLLKIQETVEGIQHKALGLPLNEILIHTIVQTSRTFYHESETLKLYPHNQAKYPLVTLEGEYYIQTRLFYNQLCS